VKNGRTMVQSELGHLLYRGWLRVENGFGIAGGIALFALMWLLFATIVGRSVGVPVVGTIEMSRELMLFAIFFGLAYTQQQGSNIKVGILVERLPKHTANCFKVIALAVGFIFAALLTYEGWLFALESLLTREFRYGLIHVPMYPGKLALFIGCALLSLRYLNDTVTAVREARSMHT